MRALLAIVLVLSTPLAHADPRAEADADAATLRQTLRDHPLSPVGDPIALERRARTRRITGGLLLGFGLASAAGGMITTFGSFAADALASLGCEDDSNCTQAHRYERATQIGGAFMGVGVASALAGGIVFSLGNADRKEARRLQLSMSASAKQDGGTVLLGGRF